MFKGPVRTVDDPRRRHRLTIAALMPALADDDRHARGDRARHRGGARRRSRAPASSEVDAAVARARAAFPAWRALAPGDRAARMRALVGAMEAEHEAARGARGAQRRQADRLRAGRDRDGDRDDPLLLGGARAPARRHDPGRRRAGVHVPRAARRRRPDHPVELPAGDRLLEARARRSRPATRSCSSPPS